MKDQVRKAASAGELKGIIDLRYKILRAPWQQPASSAMDEHEQSSVNAYILNDSYTVIACGRLQVNENGKAQVRYMAVDDSEQGKGRGTAILNFLENEAKKLGVKEIELQARENALKFYERQYYVNLGPSFLLWGRIQHYLMRKIL